MTSQLRSGLLNTKVSCRRSNQQNRCLVAGQEVIAAPALDASTSSMTALRSGV